MPRHSSNLFTFQMAACFLVGLFAVLDLVITSYFLSPTILELKAQSFQVSISSKDFESGVFRVYDNGGNVADVNLRDFLSGESLLSKAFRESLSNTRGVEMIIDPPNNVFLISRFQHLQYFLCLPLSPDFKPYKDISNFQLTISKLSDIISDERITTVTESPEKLLEAICVYLRSDLAIELYLFPFCALLKVGKKFRCFPLKLADYIDIEGIADNRKLWNYIFMLNIHRGMVFLYLFDLKNEMKNLGSFPVFELPYKEENATQALDGEKKKDLKNLNYQKYINDADCIQLKEICTNFSISQDFHNLYKKVIMEIKKKSS